jgi:hypothetical protein
MGRPTYLAILVWAGLALLAWGQRKGEPKPAAGDVAVNTWRVGMIVTADGGAFQRIVGTVTVPMDWPEQQVRVVDQDLSPGVSVSYQTIEGVARQMLVKIPSLPAGNKARAVVTFEIKRLLASPPENTDDFNLPNAKRSDRKFAPFLGPSPYIESNSPQVIEAARLIGTDKEKAWEKVEAIYDWVRAKVKFEDNQGGPVKTTVATLREGTGDCDEMSSLFVALCRADGIPARLVRVPGHCYPEFYLLDREGKGHWFPCQAAGTRAFGAMPDPRPILQKGDNVLASEPGAKKKTKVRFLPETLIGLPAGGRGALKLKLVCEPAKT